MTKLRGCLIVKATHAYQNQKIPFIGFENIWVQFLKKLGLKGTHLKLKRKTVLECSQKLLKDFSWSWPTVNFCALSRQNLLSNKKDIKKKHTSIESNSVCSVPKKSRGMGTLVTGRFILECNKSQKLIRKRRPWFSQFSFLSIREKMSILI